MGPDKEYQQILATFKYGKTDPVTGKVVEEHIRCFSLDPKTKNDNDYHKAFPNGAPVLHEKPVLSLFTMNVKEDKCKLVAVPLDQDVSETFEIDFECGREDPEPMRLYEEIQKHNDCVTPEDEWLRQAENKTSGKYKYILKDFHDCMGEKLMEHQKEMDDIENKLWDLKLLLNDAKDKEMTES